MALSRRKSISIFYNGIEAGKDLSPYLEKFTYTDSVDESDGISLSLSDRDLKWSGGWMPKTGDIIQPTILLENWGRVKGKQGLPCGSFIVDDFSFSAPPTMVSINGVSAPVGSSFKESENTKTWEQATLRLIAGEIAGRYGLSLAYDVPNEIPISKTEQSSQADSSFLKGLCGKYGLGLKVYTDRLVIWDYREYFKREPAMEILPTQVSKWSYKSTMQGMYTGARVSYTDPGSKKTVDVTVGSGERLYKTTQKADNEADARLIGEGAVLNANRKGATMQLTLPPELRLVATNTVKLAGFGMMDGKYFIEKVAHSLSKKAYGMQVSLSRIGGSPESAGIWAGEGNGEAGATAPLPEEGGDNDTEW